MLHHSPFIVLCATAAVSLTAISGCAGSSAPTTSTLRGTLDQSSFAAPITKITVHSDKGDRTVPVAASGAFQAVLDRGAEYRFLLSEDGKSMPIMLRSVAGRLDTTVRVKTGGATVNLGAVKYWAGARSIAAGIAAPPVSNVEAPATCEDNEGDDDNNNCEDGIDPSTGLECDGGPAANGNDGAEQDDGVEDTDGDVQDEMGMPEFGLPNDIGCEGGDGEEAD